MKIKRDRTNRHTTVSQRKYLDDIAAKYAARLRRDRSVPMDPAYPTQLDESERCDVHEYLFVYSGTDICVHVRECYDDTDMPTIISVHPM